LEVLFFVAKYETYQVGSGVRLRRVGEQKAVVAKPAAAVAVDESLSKAELVELAEQHGVDASGTKAEIVERLNG